MTTYELSHLRALEAEAIHIIREVAAEFERPVLLFSRRQGLGRHAAPGREGVLAGPLPFPVMHVDTGHNFHEVIEFRDRRVAELGVRLVVASVQDVDRRRAAWSRRPGPRASRNRLQTVTLLDAIEEHALRRRVRRRPPRRGEGPGQGAGVLSFRDEFGQWDPKNQRPELWSLYNGRHRQGEHIRVFPLSNWTELDIWQYIADEDIELPSIYFAHRARGVPSATACCWPSAAFVTVGDGEEVVRGDRCASAPSATPRAPAPSSRRPAPSTRSSPRSPPPGITERGATRADDRHQRGRHGRPQAGGLLLMAELLRFATAGSVDDGKSTLIGRLLYDSKAIFEDQLEAVERTSSERGRRVHEPRAAHRRPAGRARAGHHDRRRLPLLRHAQAQVHHRRHPGHIQYTRNMVTGASTADLALVLVDARNGVSSSPAATPSSPRCCGIPHLVLCVNKMDLVDYDRGALRGDPGRVPRRSPRSSTSRDLTFIPISALHGDNVVDRSANMPWYEGSSLLHHLEEVHIASRPQPHRRPLPGAVRDPPDSDEHHDYRGYAGTVAGGVLKPGRRGRRAAVGLHVARSRRSTPPTGRSTRRSRRCRSPSASTDDIDISPRRHDLPAAQPAPRRPGHRRDGLLDDRDSRARARRQATRIKHTTRSARALVKDLQYRLDVNTLHRDEARRRRWRSTRSAASRCAPRSRCSSTSTAATATTGSFILDRRGAPTPPSAPA